MLAKKIAFRNRSKVDVNKCTFSTLGLFCFLIFTLSCKDGIKTETPINTKLKTLTHPTIIFLDSLSDSIQPRKVFLHEFQHPVPRNIPRNQQEKYIYRDEENQIRIISSPIIIQRPYLKNEKGEPVLDPKGDYYYFGDGGVSHFSTFTTDDGLALDNITSSILDSSGNLWFGTWGGGISKFDGTSFTSFTTAHGLSNNLVHCLAEDANGNIWIGTEGGGLSIYDGFSFSTKTKSDGLANNVVYGISPDSKGNIWIAAGNGGASKYDGVDFINFNKENGLQANSIIKIVEDKNGFVWFGSGDNGVFRFDGSKFLHFTLEDGLAENPIHCITQDQAGNIWFGTDGGGVFKYRDNVDLTKKGYFEKFTVAEGLGHNDVWDIKEDLKGDIWFATGGNGVSKFDGKKFTSYTTAQGLPEDVVYSISIDGSGNIWFGTAGGGVALYNGAAFTNFTPDVGLANNGVYGILEDKDGNLWFGTDGGGVSKYDGKSFTNYTTDQGLPHPLIISAIKDKKDQLWFGTGGGGLALYKEVSPGNKKASFTTFNTQHGLQNEIIYAITEDRFGNLWLGTGGGGLVKFDWNTLPESEAGFTAYTTDQGLANNYIYSILEDSKGNIWIGTGGGGISKFDGKSFTNYTTEHGLSNDIVWSILEDKTGNLWFATQGGGVSRFDGQSFQAITTREGLIDDTVYDLLEDETGNVFIGTNRGYTVVPAHVVPLSFEGMREKLEYYNTSNGFPIKDVNKGIFLDSKGNIWAGNGSDKTGLVKMNYKALRKKKEKPQIKIKSISIYEKPISWMSLHSNSDVKNVNSNSKVSEFLADEVRVFGRELTAEERESQIKEYSKVQYSDIGRFENFPKNLTLPYTQNQITIDFGTDELVRPNLMEYRYILEGYNKEWSPAIRKTSATFGNIREGNYVFKVIARYTGPSEGDGKEWSEEAVYAFSVLPPVHRTWLAYLIYFIIFLMAIKWIHVYQKNKTIRKERERSRQKELEQAKEIEKAYKELQRTQAQLIQSEKMASLGELTAGIAHEIQNPLNFVNNFSEVSAELIDEIREARSERREANKGKREMRDKNQVGESEELEDEILEDIKQNLEKIQHHGKRADLIVKGMLEHSKTGSGVKEQTDINTLAEEYLKIAYQSFMNKNKDFTGTTQNDFDPTLPKIEIVRQDIGRVLLNLINNAFYACAEQKGQLSQSSELWESFQPLVTVSTKNLGDKIQITISDNGPGIPDSIKDKIFQPFFTTKPTGQGTGLGLSLSYDIVKAHGGNIKVDSFAESDGDDSNEKKQTFTCFSITLPKMLD
jgi:signal transduction histidine kinase/ligand-binding sensor domain-containing protein